MPLMKSASPKAVGFNIRAEQDAGKPYRQALAIALNVQRKARGMANGGMHGYATDGEVEPDFQFIPGAGLRPREYMPSEPTPVSPLRTQDQDRISPDMQARIEEAADLQNTGAIFGDNPAVRRRGYRGWTGRTSGQLGEPVREPGSDPNYEERNLKALGATLADPFGLTSMAARYWAPSTGIADTLEHAQQGAPTTSAMVGGMQSAGLGAAGMPAVSPRLLATGAGAAGMLAASPVADAESQSPWDWNRQPATRPDAAADSRARASRERRNELTQEEKNLQIQLRMQELDRNAKQRAESAAMPPANAFETRGLSSSAWPSYSPQQREAFWSMPPQDELKKFKITPEQWVGMPRESRMDISQFIAKEGQKAADLQKSVFDRYPGVTMASTIGALAVGPLVMTAIRNGQLKEVSELASNWNSRLETAASTLSSSKPRNMSEAIYRAQQAQAMTVLNNFDREMNTLVGRHGTERVKGFVGSMLGAVPVAAAPHEFEAGVDSPSLAWSKLLNDPYSLARIGALSAASAESGVIAPKLLNRGDPDIYRSLYPLRRETNIALGKNQLRYGPKDVVDSILARRRASIGPTQEAPEPAIVKGPGPNMVPWIGAGAAGAAGYGLDRWLNRADGGAIPSYARGGDTERYGMMYGPTAGRADKVPLKPRAGSYIIPADVVSALGQGNSIAGAKKLDARFKAHLAGGGVTNPFSNTLKMGPYGTAPVHMPKMRAFRMPRSMSLAPTAGYAMGGSPPTDIMISDGEYAIPPEEVQKAGGPDVMDQFVNLVRSQNIQHLKSLPPPRGTGAGSFENGGPDDAQTTDDPADDTQYQSANLFSPDDFKAMQDRQQQQIANDPEQKAMMTALSPYTGNWPRQLGRR